MQYPEERGGAPDAAVVALRSPLHGNYYPPFAGGAP